MQSTLDLNRSNRSTIIHVLRALLLVLPVPGFIVDAAGAPTAARHAESAVEGWLAAERAPLGTALGQHVKRTETFKDAAGTDLYHVVYLNPKGFVIVAADDLIEPILGFAPNGTYDPSTDNSLGALVSRDLPGRVTKVKGMDAASVRGAMQEANHKWRKLQSPNRLPLVPKAQSPSVSDIRVAPLTQTAWGQSTVGGNACYNYYTPPYSEGNVANFVSGCVATAMAQLMRFWQYPVNGVGTASYAITVIGTTQYRNLRGGDGSGGSYDWTNMVNSPSTLVQCKAVGALCADAGVATQMRYTDRESATYLMYARNAFVSTFQYANAVYGSFPYNTIELNGMINPNLDTGNPVLLGISGAPGGHAVVCDGYGYISSTLYHHLNLGWAGVDTAWYTLPTVDTSGALFSSVRDCCYNIWPTGTGEIISGRITDFEENPVAGVVITATGDSGDTYTATSNTQGIYALAKIPSSSQYTVRPRKAGYTFDDQTVSTGQSMYYETVTGNRWAVNFAATDNPTRFAASTVSFDRIDLSWVPNPSCDNVLVAWSTANTFGTPAGNCAVGNSISGGGTVLHKGSVPYVSHTGLSDGTQYYYKVWSVLPGGGYTSGVLAAANTARATDYNYTTFNNAIIITQYSGSDSTVALPALINGLPVTTIGDQAFEYCSSLTSVTIPSSVTSIGNNAFAGCFRLSRVTIPTSVTSIGDNAFADCSTLIRVTIPSSLSSIGNNAFAGCSNLIRVTIPSSVTTIGSNAFEGCSRLSSVTISPSVTTIGSNAFEGCSSLGTATEIW